MCVKGIHIIVLILFFGLCLCRHLSYPISLFKIINYFKEPKCALLCFSCHRPKKKKRVSSKNSCFPCLQSDIIHKHVDQGTLFLLDSSWMTLLAIRLRNVRVHPSISHFPVLSSKSTFWTRKKKAFKIIFMVVSVLQLRCLSPHSSSGLIWLIWLLMRVSLFSVTIPCIYFSKLF